MIQAVQYMQYWSVPWVVDLRTWFSGVTSMLSSPGITCSFCLCNLRTKETKAYVRTYKYAAIRKSQICVDSFWSHGSLLKPIEFVKQQVHQKISTVLKQMVLQSNGITTIRLMSAWLVGYVMVIQQWPINVNFYEVLYVQLTFCSLRASWQSHHHWASLSPAWRGERTLPWCLAHTGW